MAITKPPRVYKQHLNLIDAIKTLQIPSLIDPLDKHTFDSYIVESMQKQRSIKLHKEVSNASGKLDNSIVTKVTSMPSTKDSIASKGGIKSQISMKSSIRKARDE